MERRRSNLGKFKQNKLLEMFVAGVPARTAAELAGVHRHSATLYYQKLREMIGCELEDESPFEGEGEVDESYFGGHRKGARGRQGTLCVPQSWGCCGQVPVFGILKRGGKVYAKVIADASSETLMPMIKARIRPDSIVYSDSWKAYNALDVSEFKHLRVNHSVEYVDAENRKNHINGIENFWNQAKLTSRKHKGIPKEGFIYT
jgi:transposase